MNRIPLLNQIRGLWLSLMKKNAETRTDELRDSKVHSIPETRQEFDKKKRAGRGINPPNQALNKEMQRPRGERGGTAFELKLKIPRWDAYEKGTIYIGAMQKIHGCPRSIAKNNQGFELDSITRTSKSTNPKKLLSNGIDTRPKGLRPVMRTRCKQDGGGMRKGS